MELPKINPSRIGAGSHGVDIRAETSVGGSMFIILILILMLTLAGCGSDSSSSPDPVAPKTPVGIVTLLTGTTNAAANTAAISNAMSACSSNGCILQFPAGKYYIRGGLTISVPLTIQGMGSGSTSVQYQNGNAVVDIASTQLIETQDGVALFTTAADNITFKDIRLSCQISGGSMPPSSALSTAIATTTNSSNHIEINNVFVDGFYYGVNKQHGRYWTVDDNDFYNNVYADLVIANLDNWDEGDMTLVNNRFVGGNLSYAPSPYAGILHNSSAGMKMSGNKFNSGFVNTSGNYSILTYDMVILPTSVPSNNSVSEINIENNSFGAFLNDGIFINLPNPGTTSQKISIIGNNFLRTGNYNGDFTLNQTGYYGVREKGIFNGTQEGTLEWLQIANNMITGGIGIATIDNAVGVFVDSNTVLAPVGSSVVNVAGSSGFGGIMRDNNVIYYTGNYGSGKQRNNSTVLYSNAQPPGPTVAEMNDEVMPYIYGHVGSATASYSSGSGTTSVVFTMNPPYGSNFNFSAQTSSAAGTMVYLSGFTWSGGSCKMTDNYFAQVTNVNGNNITVYIPSGANCTVSGSGTISYAGNWYEIILTPDMPVTLDLDINANLYNSHSVGARLNRTFTMHDYYVYMSQEGQDAVTTSNGVGVIGNSVNTNGIKDYTTPHNYIKDVAIGTPATAMIHNPIYTDAYSATTTASSACSGTSLSIASATGTANGQAVYGVGILPNTIIASGGGTTSLTLNQPAFCASGATINFSDGTAGEGFEVLFWSTPFSRPMSGQFTSCCVTGCSSPCSDGQIMTQQLASSRSILQAGLSQYLVGEFVYSGIAYNVSGVSISGGQATITLSSYPTPFFSVGDRVYVQNIGGITGANCNYLSGDYYKQIMAANSTNHTITIDATGMSGSFTSGGTVSQLRQITDIIDDANFTVDYPFRPAEDNDTNLMTMADNFVSSKVTVIVRPVNGSGQWKGNMKAAFSGSPYKIIKNWEQP